MKVYKVRKELFSHDAALKAEVYILNIYIP